MKPYASQARAFGTGALATLLLTAGGAAAATPDQEIRSVLDRSAAAWSAGDLDGFMQSYEHGPDTAFVTKEGLLKSWRAIRERYAVRYGAGHKGEMGRLLLTVQQVRMIAPTYAMATARYTVVRAGKPDASGPTSLLFHRSTAGWRIVYDHSS